MSELSEKCSQPELAKLADNCDCAFSFKHRALDLASMDRLEKKIADQQEEIKWLKKETALLEGLRLDDNVRLAFRKKIAAQQALIKQLVEVCSLAKREINIALAAAKKLEL